MTALAKAGSVALNTSTGHQAITGAGFKPSAIIAWVTLAVTDATTAATASESFGWAIDGNVGQCIASCCNDTVAPSVTKCIDSPHLVKLMSDATTPTIAAVIDLFSMDSDGFTLNITTAPGSAYILNYIIFDSTKIPASKMAMGSIAMPKTGATPVSSATTALGIGGAPDLVMFMSAVGPTASDTAVSNAGFMFGAAHSATQRGVMCDIAANAKAASSVVSNRIQRNDKCVCTLTPGGGNAISWQADLTSMDDASGSGGFTLSFDTITNATSNRLFYLAIKGGNWFIGSHATPGSTGNESFTGVGFAPSLLMMFGSGRQNGSTSASGITRRSFGANDGTTDRAGGNATAQSAAAAAKSYVAPTVINYPGVGSGTSGAATTTTLDSDGATLNWSSIVIGASDTLFIAGQPAVTSVTKTLSASYNVKVSVAKTLSPSYTVKLAVAKTLVPAYTVRKAIVKTVTPAYNVIQRIAKTLSPAFNIHSLPVFTINPVVTGTPLSGQVLTEDGGTVRADPIDTVTKTQVWQVETAAGSGVFVDMTPETATTLQL